MLTLAVTTNAETYNRIRSPLGTRDIDVQYIQPDERILPLTTTLPTADDFDVGFVYPSRLMEGDVLTTHLGIPWVNDRTAILTSRNKAGVLTRLAAHGIPVPDSTLISNPVSQPDLRGVYESFEPPVVVKPNSATRGIGIAKLYDLDSFLGVTDYLDVIHRFEATGDQSFLVQEYLDATHDYRVMVLDGTYAGAVERQLPPTARDRGQWKHNVHRNATATGVQLTPDLRALAEDVAHLLDIPLLGVDILVTPDRTVVTEVNARPTIDDTTKYEPGFYDRLATLIRATSDQ